MNTLVRLSIILLVSLFMLYQGMNAQMGMMGYGGGGGGAMGGVWEFLVFSKLSWQFLRRLVVQLKILRVKNISL